MKKVRRFFQGSGFWLAMMASFVTAGSALAATTVTGDFSPAEPFWSDGGGSQVGFIGSGSDGSLTLDSGSVVAINAITFGQSSGATGTVVIEDSGSYLDITQNLYIGDEGTGDLTVQNGGRITTQVNETFLGRNATGVGTVLVTGEDSYMSSKDDLYIGNYGTGTLRVEDGGYVLAERFTYIGYRDGSISSATVTGTGSELYSTSRMYTGLYGTGTLNVEEGGLVTVNNYAYLGHYGRDTDPGRGNGTANISGAGTEYNMRRAFFIGYWGDGELNVEDGASVTNTTESVLLGFAGVGVGTATIRGVGSELNVPGKADGSEGVIYLGYYGQGTLNVEEGAVVTNLGTYIGARYSESEGRGNGVATVTGTGSEWNNSLFMVVGRGGDGTMNIEDGGVVNSADGYLGTMDTTSLSLGDGTVIVVGAGSQWNNTGGVDGDENIIAGNLYVGHDGAGELNIADGGLVTNSDDGFIGFNAGSSGTVDVSGADSEWRNSGSLFVGQSGSGTLSVGNGGLVTVSANDLPMAQGLGFGVDAGSSAVLRFDIGDDGTGTIRSGFIDAGGLFFGEGSSTLEIDVDGGVFLVENDSFELVGYDAWDGNYFDNVGDGGILVGGGYNWLIDYDADIGGRFGIVATVVPEPSVGLLLISGLAGLALGRRKRRD